MTGRTRNVIIAVVLAISAAVFVFAYGWPARTARTPGFVEHGTASWYGPGFHGKKTASGERFDQNEFTAAHRKLPLGTEVTVIDLRTGKRVQVEINDRGPYAGGRKIDLSKAAAKKLGILGRGTARVRIEASSEQLNKASHD